jgi:L-lactate utilization protein LutC
MEKRLELWHVALMRQNKTLDTLMERAASWPEEAQTELVQFMIDTEARNFGVFRLSQEDRVEIEKRIAAADRNEFASEDEVEALFARYRA